MKQVLLILVALLTAGVIATASPLAQPRNVLQKAYGNLDKNLIQAGGEWFPYPKYSDREAWDKLFGESRSEFIRTGEKYLNYEWKLITASNYFDYERTGSRAPMSDKMHANKSALETLMLAELAEGKGRFIEQIINGVWLETERTSWVASAHQFRQKSGRVLPDARDIIIDLSSQMNGANMAMAWHFFKDAFDVYDPSIACAIERSIRRNIFEPYLDDSKIPSHFWLARDLKPGESAHNWTVWTSANVILAFLLVDKDRDEILRAIARSIESVDKFLDTNKMDGACEEGPSYWEHSAGCLYDYLRILNYATKNQFGCLDDPQVRAMASYPARIYVGDGWTVNFCDGSARATGAAPLYFRYGMDSSCPEMMDLSVRLGLKAADAQSPFRMLETLRYMDAFKAYEIQSNIPVFSWYSQTEHLFIRNSRGWMLGAKAGHNDEAHNHNDVGSCVLYVDEIPVLIDAGVGTYTLNHWNDKRYTIWNMRSDWHNVPIINGSLQHDGKRYAASKVSVSEAKGILTADIAGAYDNADCKSFVRTLRMKPGKVSKAECKLTITDSFELNSRKAPDVETFLVRGKVEIVRPGELTVESASFDGNRSVKVTMTYPKDFTPSIDFQKLDDPKLSVNWGSELTRISLTSPAGAPLKGAYEITVKSN